ncbi:hypothetical protein NYA9BBAC_00357 [Salinibacterium sp. NYA9b]
MPLAAIEPTFIESLAAWSTLSAAIATTLSAVFIASQVFLTRRSLNTTEETLGLARDEIAHAALLRTDAQRAAIDAEMPRLTVEVTRQAREMWRNDKFEADPERLSDESQPVELKVGEEFITPRDNAIPIAVGMEISVSNDGPRRARVRIDHPEGGREVVIMPGAATTQWVTREQSLQEWIEIALLREGGTSEEREVAGVTYEYPGDFGANESHRVVQGGTIVERVPGNMGGWRIKSLAPSETDRSVALKAVTMPFTRTYWASRERERGL